MTVDQSDVNPVNRHRLGQWDALKVIAVASDHHKVVAEGFELFEGFFVSNVSCAKNMVDFASNLAFSKIIDSFD